MKRFVAFLCTICIIITFIPTVFSVPTNKILSDNKFNDTVVDAVYKNMGAIKTGATYQWTPDSDTDMRTNDTGSVEMQGGGCDLTGSEATTNSAWDQAGTSTLIFDLKRVYTINQVDIWSMFGGNDKMGRFEVFTSGDGATYAKVGEGDATAVYPTADNTMFNTSATLTPSDAQYVKITIYKGAAYKMVIGEAVIFGTESVDPKGELKENLKLAKKYVNRNLESVYETSSWTALTTAISAGDTVVSNATASEMDIATANTNVVNAINGLVCLFNTQVLSSNKFSENEKASYPTLYQNNATYIFTGGHTSITGNAEALKLLTNGGITADSTVGSELLWGGWQDSTPAVVVFDLKGEFYLTNVDVYSLYNSNDVKFIDGFDVELSTNGVDYQKVATAKGTADTGAKLVSTKSTFLPQKATHVRVTINNGVGSNQLVFGEIVLQGFSSKADKTALEKAINSANIVDKTIFTIASWENVEKSLAAAKIVYQNATATVSDVTKATTDLTTAMGNLVYLYQTKVITDNGFTPDELANLYPCGNETTNVQYQWIDGGNPELITNDGGLAAPKKKMQSGNVKDFNGETILFGKWDDQTPTTAKYTFPSECYINQVDLWSKMDKGSVRMGGFTVEISGNDVDYTKVASVENPTWYKDLAAGENKMVNTVAKFPAVKAKYVKITAYNGSIDGVGEVSHQLVISEIIMQGFKAPFVPPIQFQMFDVTYENGAYTPVSKLSDIDDKLLVSGDIFNNSNQDKNVTAISVLYNNQGKIVGMGVNDVVAAKSKRTSFSITIAELAGVLDNYSLKTYVWDNVNNCIPLSKAVTFGEI